jgi:hypothetical protein
MKTDKEKIALPPFVSFRTFNKFLNQLKQMLPVRLDRSYWGEMYSGKTGAHLILAMRFLNLIDIDSRPTPRLKLLLFSDGEHRSAMFRVVAKDAYAFVLKGTLSIENATYNDIEQLFLENYNMKIDTCHLCVKFFVQFSKAVGISLSNELIKKRT